MKPKLFRTRIYGPSDDNAKWLFGPLICAKDFKHAQEICSKLTVKPVKQVGKPK